MTIIDFEKKCDLIAKTMGLSFGVSSITYHQLP